jgi:uncharacterized protein YkwD
VCASLSLTCGLSGIAANASAASAPRASSAASTASHQRSAQPSQRRTCRAKSARRHPRKSHAACASLRPSSRKQAGADGRSPTASQRARGAALQSSSVVAAVLATPCVATEITPAPENLALLRAAVLCLVNHVRAQNGESPLTLSARLEQAAEAHCAEMISADYFAHVAPNGETPVDRIRATGYIPGAPFGYVIGENLAWGTYGLATPQAIVSAWVASPEHLANILEAKYTETGIGIAAAVPPSLSGGSPGATYGQEFGVILG